jgi:hypothetical protein
MQADLDGESLEFVRQLMRERRMNRHAADMLSVLAFIRPVLDNAAEQSEDMAQSARMVREIVWKVTGE